MTSNSRDHVIYSKINRSIRLKICSVRLEKSWQDLEARHLLQSVLSNRPISGTNNPTKWRKKILFALPYQLFEQTVVFCNVVLDFNWATTAKVLFNKSIWRNSSWVFVFRHEPLWVIANSLVCFFLSWASFVLSQQTSCWFRGFSAFVCTDIQLLQWSTLKHTFFVYLKLISNFLSFVSILPRFFQLTFWYDFSSLAGLNSFSINVFTKIAKRAIIT